MTREDAEHQSEHWQDLIDEKDAEIERLKTNLDMWRFAAQCGEQKRINLKAQLATAKGEVSWTTQKPTKPGYWWWRWLDKSISPRPVYVLEHNGSLRSGWLPKGWTLEFVDGEWSSEPIAEPKELA